MADAEAGEAVDERASPTTSLSPRAAAASSPPLYASAPVSLGASPAPPSPAPAPRSQSLSTPAAHSPAAVPRAPADARPAAPPAWAGAGALRAYLAEAGFGAAQAEELAGILAGAGIALPADPAALPWARIKELPGVKLGAFTKLRRYAERTANPT